MAQNLRKDRSFYEEIHFVDDCFEGVPDLVRLIDDRDQIEVHFVYQDGIKHKLTIGNVLSYRCTEEGFMLSAINKMRDAGVLNRLAILVYNSDYISWLKSASMDTMGDMNLLHLRLCFSQNLVDFIIVGEIGSALKLR